MDITFKNYVNIPSRSEIYEIKEKFPAYVSADVSEKAKTEGVESPDRFNSISYPLRDPLFLEYTYARLSYISHTGYYFTHPCLSNAGLRVSLQLTYKQNSKVVKHCKSINRTAKVVKNEDDQFLTEVVSTAPIVTFGKLKYIWLNKEECKEQIESTMRLVSVEAIANATFFDKDRMHNDYGLAEEIRKQCEEEAFGKNFENLSNEEKSLLVPVELTREDGYQSAKPILEKAPKTTTRNSDGGRV